MGNNDKNIKRLEVGMIVLVVGVALMYGAGAVSIGFPTVLGVQEMMREKTETVDVLVENNDVVNVGVDFKHGGMWTVKIVCGNSSVVVHSDANISMENPNHSAVGIYFINDYVRDVAGEPKQTFGFGETGCWSSRGG